MKEFNIVPGETIDLEFVLPNDKFKVYIKKENKVVKSYTQLEFNKENNLYTKEIDTIFMEPYTNYIIQLYSFETDLDETDIHYIRSWFVSTKDKWDM